MENANNFTLITGKFNATDAKSIVLNFYNTKILFHNQQLLRIAEGIAGDSSTIEKKILALKNTKEEIFALLSKANNDHEVFEIEGHISINELNKNG